MRVWEAVVAGKAAPPDTVASAIGLSGAMDGMVRDRLVAVPRFDVSNVAEFLFAESDQDEWVWRRDFPNLAPPFPRFWMEHRRVGRINRGGRVEEAEPWAGSTGCLFEAMPTGSLGAFVSGMAERFGDMADVMGRLTGAPGDGWILFATLYQENLAHGRVVGPVGGWAVAVCPDGTVADDPVEFVPGELLALGGSVLGPAMFAFALAISFLHCKNVEVVERGGRWPSRQAKRAAERRGDPPPPRFYVLEIDPMRKRLEVEGGTSRNGLRRALHIARGHFQTYTEERPMFGKHAGTFWVPAHVRGGAEAGMIGKDYLVKPPKGAS